MRARLYLAVVVLALVWVATSAAKTAVPPLLFPVVGATSYHDDFGDARSDGPPHPGNDLLAAKRAPAVAVEAGTVSYWTTSPSAGCMLYLHGESGTMYEYIHLNNDLTARNDNKGKCVQGVSYAVPDGASVEAGETIGYVGDSGDANGIHPHLHFEIHPHAGKAIDPFPFLRKATHLLVASPPSGKVFTLKLTGTVVELTATALTLNVSSLAAWPSHLKQSKLALPLTISIPADASVTGDGENVIVWTAPVLGTLDAMSGAPGALSADRIQLR
jgi:peptidase M23-like protein